MHQPCWCDVCSHSPRGWQWFWYWVEIMRRTLIGTNQPVPVGVDLPWDCRSLRCSICFLNFVYFFLRSIVPLSLLFWNLMVAFLIFAIMLCLQRAGFFFQRFSMDWWPFFANGIYWWLSCLKNQRILQLTGFCIGYNKMSSFRALASMHIVKQEDQRTALKQ